MTIAELLAATGLTENDLVPIWDAEAAQNVEPTQKVTAAQLAAAVKVLASLPNTTEMNAAIQQSTAKSTSTANVTIYTGNITAYVNKLLKCAGLVYAFLEVETTSGQALTISDAFARIPSGWRPKVAEEFPASILQSNDIWATYKVSIGTNGDIKQLLTNTAKGVSFVAVYEHE